MAGITLTQAQAQLDALLAASTAVAGGQSYEMNGRRLTRANLKEIQDSIIFWDGYVKRLSGSTGGRVSYIEP